jgi:hypothetical protein
VGSCSKSPSSNSARSNYVINLLCNNVFHEEGNCTNPCANSVHPTLSIFRDQESHQIHTRIETALIGSLEYVSVEGIDKGTDGTWGLAYNFMDTLASWTLTAVIFFKTRLCVMQEVDIRHHIRKVPTLRDILVVCLLPNVCAFCKKVDIRYHN